MGTFTIVFSLATSLTCKMDPHYNDYSRELIAEPNLVMSAETATEAHAAARWARAVVQIMGSPRDPRTITGWGQWIAASPGAVRNWCRTAGIRARRSLLFGRILRAVALSEGGRHKLENLLDVVDRRTLTALMKCAGLDGQQAFPTTVHDFLERQTLVRDPDLLSETRRALRARQLRRDQLVAANKPR